MEPAFQRGDLLLLTLEEAPINPGEIVVYKLPRRDIPIVHRVLVIHEKYGSQFWSSCVSHGLFCRQNKSVDILTKGDHNIPGWFSFQQCVQLVLASQYNCCLNCCSQMILGFTMKLYLACGGFTESTL